MSTTALVEGKIVQCIGAVIDVEFPRSDMPKIYDALVLEGSELTLEVQQQLGDGVVRTICLGASDGLLKPVPPPAIRDDSTLCPGFSLIGPG